ncbi:MAG: hypothetical protein HWE13_12105 [Gammaproteobacteria bacterium]|nr:hypothetical protein [Gammaproteobacteria bacterium]
MHKFIATLIMAFVFIQYSNATSVVKTYNEITKENSASFGIEVYITSKNIYCQNGLEVWISAPKRAVRGYFNLGTSMDRHIVSGAIAVQKYIEGPILESSAEYASGKVDQELVELQENYGFMAGGFIGALLCVEESQLKNTNFKFDDRRSNGLITTTWEMGALDKWRK